MRVVSLAFPLAAVHGLVPVRHSLGVELHRAEWMRADPARQLAMMLRSAPDDVDDEVAVASDADFGGAVINAVTAVLGVAVALSTVCNLAGYGFMQTDEGVYFGTIHQTRMRYQLDEAEGRR